MHLVLLVAVAQNGVIGVDNQLPWHLPEDLRRFKALTTGRVVVMGRKTFDSIVERLGKPLPNRLSVVLTRNSQWRPSSGVLEQAALCGARVEVVHRLQDVEAIAQRHDPTGGPVYVIGGAEVYAATLPLAKELDITRVDIEVAGDAFFPEFNPAQWTCSQSDVQVSDTAGIRYRFERYRRNP